MLGRNCARRRDECCSWPAECRQLIRGEPTQQHTAPVLHKLRHRRHSLIQSNELDYGNSTRGMRPGRCYCVLLETAIGRVRIEDP